MLSGMRMKTNPKENYYIHEEMCWGQQDPLRFTHSIKGDCPNQFTLKPQENKRGQQNWKGQIKALPLKCIGFSKLQIRISGDGDLA